MCKVKEVDHVILKPKRPSFLRPMSYYWKVALKAVTVDKIAERAKVSKATIYKWWPNKAAVVMDGFLSAAAARLPVPDTGSALNDILIHATSLASFLISREGTIINELVGEGQFDSKLAEEYRARYFQPRRLQAKQLLEKGINRGELKRKPRC